MTVFYRKYRPQKFADLVGQETIAKTLLAQLESGKIGHGYLFFGPKGTGKTSTARIFAKAVNCQRLAPGKLASKFGEPCGKCVSCLAVADGSHLDLIEIDAASNRGIDEIRDLREKIKLSPVSSRFKVYIIDEVHMLTGEAFNALLKTLEEPPSHAIFILCTTEVSKLPSTIVSRLQRFNFQRASDAAIEKVIGKIAKAENVNIEKEAIEAIARVCDGSFRDAVSILDQLGASGKKIAAKDVRDIARVSGQAQLFSFGKMLAARDLAAAVLFIDEVSSTLDVSLFTRDFVNFLKKLLFINIGIGAEALDIEADQFGKMKIMASEFGYGNLNQLMKLLILAEGEIKFYPQEGIPLILAVCKYVGEPADADPAAGAAGSPAIFPASARIDTDSGPSRPLRAAGGLSSRATPHGSIQTSSVRATRGDKPNSSTESGKSAGKVALDEVQKYWGQFLEKVKRKTLTCLRFCGSLRPVRVEGDSLVLEVFFRFHKEKLEEIKIGDRLSNILSDLLSKQIRMRFMLANREARPPKVVEASDVTDINGDDLSKIAAEIFSKIKALEV